MSLTELDKRYIELAMDMDTIMESQNIIMSEGRMYREGLLLVPQSFSIYSQFLDLFHFLLNFHITLFYFIYFCLSFRLQLQSLSERR